ncbi:SDR family oxidoreductase [Roseibium sp. AS2]|uniref:SDR family oxidoreductase n=1 Tax=Roseibium sp. AS2 TaxID=3135781 RepID=UPI00317B6C4F
MRFNVLVAGATGKTGQLVIDELIAQGHAPTALVRAGSDIETLPEGVALRQGDLTALQAGVCQGMDAVVFAAGSGGSTGADMTEKVDRDGAQKLVDQAREAGVRRFVMLSSVGADQSDPDGDLAHYLKAKHDADEHLKASGLNFAILRPVALSDEDGSDGVVLGADVDKTATASRADVARLLAVAATTDRFDGAAVDMQSA